MIGLAFCSICCALMYTMIFAWPVECTHLSGLNEILENLSISFKNQSVETTILALVFYFIGGKVLAEKRRSNGVIVISIIIGSVWLMAESYKLDNSLYNITVSGGQVIKALIYLCGATFFAFLILSLLIKLFSESACYKYDNFSGGRIKTWVYKHLFLCVFIILVMSWSYPLILSYPANMSWDHWYQLQQFWRYSPFNTHQPIMHTLIVGTFTLIGKVFGSSNVGLFMFVIVQTFVYALVIAYSFVLLKKLKAPIWLMAIYIITCIFSPYYVNYSNTVLKDSLYSICFLLFIIELVYALIDTEQFLKQKKDCFFSVLSIFGVLTLRSNGKFILYPFFMVLILLLFRKYRNNAPILMAKAIAIMIIPIIAVLGFNFVFKASVSEVQNVSRVEALSLPLQQTARVVSIYSDEITENEKDVINRVLEYDKLADEYNPRISDPVKALFREDCTNNELVAYLFSWGKMFFKYPMVYLETIVNQNYGLLYLRVENNTVYTDWLADGELAEKFEKGIGLHEYKGFQAQKENLFDWYMIMYSFPGIGVLSHPALYVLALIVISLLTIKHKKCNCIIALMPIWEVLLFIILGPVFHGHPRYAFPIIYSMPIIAAYYMGSDIIGQ